MTLLRCSLGKFVYVTRKLWYSFVVHPLPGEIQDCPCLQDLPSTIVSQKSLNWNDLRNYHKSSTYSVIETIFIELILPVLLRPIQVRFACVTLGKRYITIRCCTCQWDISQHGMFLFCSAFEDLFEVTSSLSKESKVVLLGTLKSVCLLSSTFTWWEDQK